MAVKIKQADVKGTRSMEVDVLKGIKTINYESIIGEGNIDVGGSGGEPAKYLKEATVQDDKLTLTRKNNTTVELDVSGKATKTELTTEKDLRVQGDTALQQNITNEATARTQADTALQNSINLKADASALATEVSQRQSQYSQLDTRINAKQDKLTAGTNITIVDNVISATGGGSNLETITVGGEKLTPLDKDIKIVLGNSLAYSDQEPGLAYKNLHVNFKSTHGLEVDGTNGLKVKLNKDSGTLSLDANGLKVADNKFVELPVEPIKGQGLNVPYYFDVEYTNDKATVNDYTVDLLNKNKAPQKYSLTINAASTDKAGLMVAADKSKLNNLKEVEANPTLGGSEANLLGIKIGDTKYKVFEGTSYTAGQNIKIENNVISAEANQLALEGTTGTLTAAQRAILLNKSVSILRDNKVHTFHSSSSGSSGEIRTYSLIIDNNIYPMYHYILVNMLTGVWNAYTTNLQDKLIAGTNITIDESTHTISATGGSTYTAGDAIDLTNNKIDVKYDNNTIKLNTDGKLYTTTAGTSVIANPTLVGTEANLDSIQIGETKYNSSRIKPFPSDFKTNKTLKEFGQSIVGYSQFKMGSTWYGGIECSDLPGGMMQVECKVTAIRDTTITPYENIAIIEIFSSEVAPFYWTYNTNSWEKGTGLDDWKYVAQIDESKFNSISAAVNEALDVKVKKVNAAAGSTGWEFYIEKPNTVVANPTLAGTEASLTGLQVGTTKYKVPTGGSEPSEYLLSAEVDADNHLKINNKLGQQVVDCTVNYTLDNSKVKGVLTDAEKETLASGVTGTTWIATQTNISSLQSGKQDKLIAGSNITISADNVISATGGSGEPAAYIKDAAISNEKLTLTKKDSSTVELDISGKQNKLTAGNNITIDTDNKISAADQLPEYPTDTEAEYILALKYENGNWVKYWKEIANKSDLVDKGMVDYMVIKQ